MVDFEFRIYQHYSRDQSASKIGWLRNIIHSLTQQVIRIDLLHYIVIAYLSGGQTQRFIIYPYYCRSVNIGGIPSFFRINLDAKPIPVPLDPAYILSIAYVDPWDKNYSFSIIPRMHSRLTEQEELIEKRHKRTRERSSSQTNKERKKF